MDLYRPYASEGKSYILSKFEHQVLYLCLYSALFLDILKTTKITRINSILIRRGFLLCK